MFGDDVAVAKFSETLFMPFCRVIFHLFVLALGAFYDCAMQYLHG